MTPLVPRRPAPGRIGGAVEATLWLPVYHTIYGIRWNLVWCPQNPSPGLPPWPAFDNQDPAVLYLDTQPHAGPVPHLDQLTVLEEYFAWKRAAGQAR
jgi:hypothetical protein